MFATTIRQLTRQTRRNYVTTPQAFNVFDKKAKFSQKDLAASNVEESRTVDYLKDEIAARVANRLLHATKDMMKKLIVCYIDINVPYPIEVERRVVDEELLPFEENSLDAVVISLSLNWVNDSPGALIQIKNSLKPDGVFIGTMFVDVDEIQVNYSNAFELMQDLRSMDESNAVLTRDTLLSAAAIYKELHGQPDGSIPATFQIIYLTGWKPSENTPSPKKRGSANVSLKDILDAKPE
ncbi:hypothetical protein BDF21DRAFT_421682 [Thamnidium elegans]|nr:hypothetical protein BDF21DRAFT_421682 [Thamnidium elegans]